jgi:4-hydroxythreonine-4-phosphate dehydrogenase
VLDKLWNARVTSHIALKDVASRLSVERIHRALKLTDACMRHAGFARPLIAVAGLNPHAGDGGNFGREEIDVIAPAVMAGRQGSLRKGRFPQTPCSCGRGMAPSMRC